MRMRNSTSKMNKSIYSTKKISFDLRSNSVEVDNILQQTKKVNDKIKMMHDQCESLMKGHDKLHL